MAKKVVNEQDLCKRALDFCALSEAAYSEEYSNQIEDLRFGNGEQWPEAVKRERDADDRPCLRINKIPQFVDRVLGDMRQSSPAIKVRPVDDDADPDTAEVLAGLIRNIENQSDGEIVYDTGADAMVRCGYGAWRVLTEYVSDDSFDQEIRFGRIKNQFAIRWDPKASTWNREDSRFCLLIDDMPRDAFKRRYPNADPCNFDASIKEYGDWIKEDTVRVAEFFERDTETYELFFIQYTDENGAEVQQAVKELPSFEHDVLKKRRVQSKKWYWYRLTARSILEGPRKVPGEFLPIIPDLGKETNIEGHSYYCGVIRHAKDSQRLYNYYRSYDAETIALAPKAPWIMTSAMLGSYKNMWKQANKRNFSYLLYERDPLAPESKPERNIPTLASQAIMQNIMIADQELHDTTGLQLASLGKKSNEQSGAAIQARAREGDIGQFTYIDNHSRAIKHTARVVISMIPDVYDTARVLRIIGEDKQPKNVKVNQHFVDDNDGVSKIFDMTTGKYDVTSSVGPSYETQRQESLAAMIDFVKILDPSQRSVVADKVVSTSDWHGAEDIAKRLRKMLPPGIAEPEEGEEPQQPSEAELQAQALAQAEAEAKQETQEVELEIKKAELKEAQAKAAKAEAEAAISEAEASHVASNFG